MLLRRLTSLGGLLVLVLLTTGCSRQKAEQNRESDAASAAPGAHTIQTERTPIPPNAAAQTRPSPQQRPSAVPR